MKTVATRVPMSANETVSQPNQRRNLYENKKMGVTMKNCISLARSIAEGNTMREREREKRARRGTQHQSHDAHPIFLNSKGNQNRWENGRMNGGNVPLPRVQIVDEQDRLCERREREREK